MFSQTGVACRKAYRPGTTMGMEPRISLHTYEQELFMLKIFPARADQRKIMQKTQ